VKSAIRRGITLVELLVVAAIITVLIALLVPAVQKIRAAAARSQCANNLKQIGLATQQYHAVNKAFPAGMRYKANPGEVRHKYMSWHTQLLPHLDQGPLWQATLDAFDESANPFKNPPHVGFGTLMPVFACPADARTGQLQVALRNKYTVALTSYLGVSGTDLTTLDGILFRDSQIRMADITDGASNTLLAGERPPSTDFQFGWWYAGAGQRSTGSAEMLMGVYEQNVQPVTVGSCAPGSYPFSPGDFGNQCDMFHFWSPHSGGAHFLFADGTVRFIQYSAAPIMPALASRAGGESVELP
jgi:prepilin-type processing-associated H-X9-DG protein